MEENGMSSLVVCRDLLLFFGNDTALFLRTQTYFDKRSLDIILADINSALFCR